MTLGGKETAVSGPCPEEPSSCVVTTREGEEAVEWFAKSPDFCRTNIFIAAAKSLGKSSRSSHPLPSWEKLLRSVAFSSFSERFGSANVHARQACGRAPRCASGFLPYVLVSVFPSLTPSILTGSCSRARGSPLAFFSHLTLGLPDGFQFYGAGIVRSCLYYGTCRIGNVPTIEGTRPLTAIKAKP